VGIIQHREEITMKVSQIGILAVMVVVIAVAFAGCTGSGTSPSTPATGGAAVTGGSGGAAVASTSNAASGPVSAASLFGNLGYEWVEYKMAAGQGADAMTIYYKYNHKTGKCTMRFEGAAAVQGMPSEMDCSATGAASSGGQSAGNPNDVKSDVKMVKVGTETVTVGAGTFLADKYTATSEGMTATYWIASGKPLLKMESANGGQSVVMELNSWG
jgi:hypothetical protein